MKKLIKRIFLIGAILLLLLQIYQPARNSDGEQVLPTHISNVYDVPNYIQTILKTSCYDCHSNNTKYPWYSYLQPARMMMEWDIVVGKENLNFSEFGSYSVRKQRNKLKSIIKQVKKDEMPLPAYTLIHRNAILTTNEKQVLFNWINSNQ